MPLLDLLEGRNMHIRLRRQVLERGWLRGNILGGECISKSETKKHMEIEKPGVMAKEEAFLRK